VWLALQGSSKNRLECQLSRFKESDRRSDAPSSSRSGFAFGAAPRPNEAWGTRALWGFARACTGVTQKYRFMPLATQHPHRVERVLGRRGVGRMLVACASLSPVSPPVGSASLLGFSHSIAGPACQLHSGHRVPFIRIPDPRRLVSRLCARRPASILAIGRSSDWQPPRKRN